MDMHLHIQMHLHSLPSHTDNIIFLCQLLNSLTDVQSIIISNKTAATVHCTVWWKVFKATLIEILTASSSSLFWLYNTNFNVLGQCQRSHDSHFQQQKAAVSSQKAVLNPLYHYLTNISWQWDKISDLLRNRIRQEYCIRKEFQQRFQGQCPGRLTSTRTDSKYMGYMGLLLSSGNQCFQEPLVSLPSLDFAALLVSLL